MSKRIFGLFILAALLLPVAAKADSVSPGWEFTSVNSQRSSSNVYTFGIVFTANSDMWVNYLGYYDPTGGMNYTHLVGLFDVTTETLLAYTTVTSDSDYSSAHFLYNAITPVELLNGDEYVLEGVSGDLNGTDYYTNNVSGFAVNAPITINGAN